MAPILVGQLVLIAAVAVAVDQATKVAALWMLIEGDPVAILPVMNLTLGFNEGSSFGMLGGLMAGRPLAMAALTAAITLVIILWGLRSSNWIERTGLALIVGGSLATSRTGCGREQSPICWISTGKTGIGLPSTWPMSRSSAVRRRFFFYLPFWPPERIMVLSNTIPTNRAFLAMTLAFLIALAATLSALFIGEVLGKMPCTSCWYQSISMLPLVLVLGVAALRDDTAARWTAALLALVGLFLAAWRSALFAGLILQATAPCTKDGPSCTGAAAQTVLGLPMPYLSLAAFAAALVCLSQLKGNRA